MKYIFSILLFVLAMVQPAIAQDYEPVKYDITSAGSGVQGTYLVKVFVYSKDAKVSDLSLKYAAVHGVLFRGFQGKPSAPPLAGSAATEEQKKDYFNAFFGKSNNDKTGIFQNYAEIVEGSYQRMKTSKGYKVGAIVQVNKEKLRADLSTAGIIQGLSSGF